LGPEALGVKKDSYLEMTDLLSGFIDQGQSVSTLPIGTYWLDICRPADFERAQIDYVTYFEDD